MSQPERGTGQLWAGLILITLGVLFLLDRLDVLAFRWFFRDWWPSLLILLGVVQLVTSRRRRWTGPLVLIAIGLIFQGDRLNLFPWWDWDTMWPVILIAVGAGILITRLQQRASSWHDSGRLEVKS